MKIYSPTYIISLDIDKFTMDISDRKVFLVGQDSPEASTTNELYGEHSH